MIKQLLGTMFICFTIGLLCPFLSLDAAPPKKGKCTKTCLNLPAGEAAWRVVGGEGYCEYYEKLFGLENFLTTVKGGGELQRQLDPETLDWATSKRWKLSDCAEVCDPAETAKRHMYVGVEVSPLDPLYQYLCVIIATPPKN